VMRRLARQQDRKSGDYSKFWRKRDFLRKADDVEAAVLVAHGLQDWNVKPGAASRWYEALRANDVDHMIYWHQGGHGGEPPRDVINKWFDHYLYGVDNGIDKAPRSMTRQPDGTLLKEAEWPAPAAKDRTFHLAARGDDAFGDLTKAASPGTEVFTDDASYDVEKLVNDKATEHGLIYTSGELAAESRLSGTPSVDLNLAFGAKAANVSVAVVDLRPDGTVGRVVTRGWADPQNVDSLTESKALIPGKRYQLDFEMEPNDYTFAAGHRIGFVVMSSEHDYTIRPKPGTEIKLSLPRSSITLPLVR
jgi:X-Pro dipeptidyl-peptidase